MQLTLCYSPYTCALVPYVTLTEAGATFDIRRVNLRKGEQNASDYLRLNPKHKVPTLVIDGEPLTENVAIQLWIARTFPAARLLPVDPFQELKAIAFMTWCASGIHPSLTPNFFPQRFCDVPGTEDSVKAAARKFLADHFRVADGMLAGREWLFDHFTAADAYFYWCFRRASQAGVDLQDYVHCRAHFDRVQVRPSVQKAQVFEAAVLKEFAQAG